MIFEMVNKRACYHSFLIVRKHLDFGFLPSFKFEAKNKKFSKFLWKEN